MKISLSLKLPDVIKNYISELTLMTSPELTHKHTRKSLSHPHQFFSCYLWAYSYSLIIWFVSHTRDIVWVNCITSSFAYIIIIVIIVIVISFVHAKWTSNISSARDFIDFWRDCVVVVRLGGGFFPCGGGGWQKIIIGRCAFSIFMHNENGSCCVCALKGHF